MRTSDEVLYQARIHPERYSHTLSNDQLDHLYDALIYVCKTAVDTLAEVERLPDDCGPRAQRGAIC